MQAAVLKGLNQLEVDDVPVPEIKPDEIKVQIAYCGICGSDLHMVEGKMGFGSRPDWMIGKPPAVPRRMGFPRVMGHEASGVIAEVGPAVEGDFKVGDRVAMDFKAHCGHCYFCNNGQQWNCLNRRMTTGSMAEYAVYPEGAIFALPEGMPLDIGAFLEPVSIAVHALDISQMRSGDTVLVTGGGPIGLLIMQMAIHSGASKVLVSEPVASRRKLALELGADMAIDPLNEDILEAANKLTDWRGFDVSFEASGIPAVARQALYLAESAGTVVWAAVYPMDAEIGVPPSFMYSRELSIRSVRVSPYSFPRAMRMLPKLNLKPLITRYNLSDAAQAFADQKAGKGIKLMLHPETGPE
ncbi:zinc-binding dehydrogenase [Chloroflexota bacterium]